MFLASYLSPFSTFPASINSTTTVEASNLHTFNTPQSSRTGHLVQPSVVDLLTQVHNRNGDLLKESLRHPLEASDYLFEPNKNSTLHTPQFRYRNSNNSHATSSKTASTSLYSSVSEGAEFSHEDIEFKDITPLIRVPPILFSQVSILLIPCLLLIYLDSLLQVLNFQGKRNLLWNV